MKKHVVISLEHPAWVHQFKAIIRHLEEEGCRVTVFAIDKDLTIYLLDKYGIPYILVARSTGKGVLEKAWLLMSITIKMARHLIGTNPDLFIGRGSPMIAINAFLFRRPHILYEDTERSLISLALCRMFSTKILTNSSFLRELGPKHFRVDTYKELFYLHPDEFRENPEILKNCGLESFETFTLIRFVAWTADHDLGHQGITDQLKVKAVKEFERFGKVFVTSEVRLPPELEEYKVRVAPEHIHSLMDNATLVFGESATMAVEAAMLGVHSIFCYFAEVGSTGDLEKNYGLLFNFGLTDQAVEQAIARGVELLSDMDIKLKGKQKAERLYSKKQNGTKVFLDQLEPYFS
jgi:hypothetical protein